MEQAALSKPAAVATVVFARQVRELWRELLRVSYVARCLSYDNEMNRLKGVRVEVLKRIPLLYKAEPVELGIAQFCSTATVRFAGCVDFASKRQFLVDYVEKVVFLNDRVAVHGSVPIRVDTAEDAE